MGVFSKEQMNYALLGMYVGTRGPKTLRKCITDKLFVYQMYRNEETIRMNIDAEMVHLAFPEGKSVPSLDDMDDLVLQDISSLVFELSGNEQDISKKRNLIQDLLEGSIFHEYLQLRENRFRQKNNTKKLLSKTQFAKLYPESGDPSISHLDITILCFILFEGMNFRPITDFNKLPLESDTMEADDMLRIKICRNDLVHQPVAEISDEDFDNYWECLTAAFERLSKSPFVRRESERLKSLRFSDEKIDQFKTMIQGWRMDDLDQRREHLEQVKDIVTQTGIHTESVIKATGTQIVENQNEKHEELVSLLKKNNSKRRKVQNKELKKSYPLRIHGYDKFKQVCHYMQRRGIRYTFPTASSSDSSTNSDPELLPVGRDLVDDVVRMFGCSDDEDQVNDTELFPNFLRKCATNTREILTSTKSELYSEDSTGYNTDRSAEGYMSDTPLFNTHRQQSPHLFQCINKMSKADDPYFDTRHNVPHNVSDDGYTPNEHLVLHLPQVERKGSIPRRAKHKAYKPATDSQYLATALRRGQEIPMVDSDVTECLQRIRVSTTDTAESLQSVQLSETHRLDGGSQTHNSIGDSGEKQEEIFV